MHALALRALSPSCLYGSLMLCPDSARDPPACQMPEGSFFIMGDTSAIVLPEPYASDKSVPRDWVFCRWLTEHIGVAAIPPSTFYANAKNKPIAANFARYRRPAPALSPVATDPVARVRARARALRVCAACAQVRFLQAGRSAGRGCQAPD
jgi:hypothetical protein